MAHSPNHFACLEIQVIVKFWFQTGMRRQPGLYRWQGLVYHHSAAREGAGNYPVRPDLHAIPTVVSNPRIKCETAAFGCYFCSSRYSFMPSVPGIQAIRSRTNGRARPRYRNQEMPCSNLTTIQIRLISPSFLGCQSAGLPYGSPIKVSRTCTDLKFRCLVRYW